ncbi:MAG: phosphate uptake regulator PhoU [Candidatus Micrarchaeota archaeon]|nr:phosphate uptake regulator PhoU [Candidatus Micrarchaeota archaeon]
MEVRKVQRSGKSSFIVSLPHGWAKAQLLEKNAPIFIEQNSDGTLTISPFKPKEAEKRAFTLHIAGKEPAGVLFRKMVSAYISGYGTIILVTKPESKEQSSQLAARFVAATVGQEIVEEGANAIVIKDILNPAELPMQKAARRMDSLCARMIEMAAEKLQGGAPEIGILENAEKEVDRLLWLVARKHHRFLIAPPMASAEGTSLPESHLYFMCAVNMERASDHARAICKAGRKSAKLRTLLLSSQSFYTEATAALFSKDEARAQRVIEGVLANPQSYESFLRGEAVPSWQVACLASIRRISEYSAGICENLIDFMA